MLLVCCFIHCLKCNDSGSGGSIFKGTWHCYGILRSNNGVPLLLMNIPQQCHIFLPLLDWNNHRSPLKEITFWEQGTSASRLSTCYSLQHLQSFSVCALKVNGFHIILCGKSCILSGVRSHHCALNITVTKYHKTELPLTKALLGSLNNWVTSDWRALNACSSITDRRNKWNVPSYSFY